MYPETGSVSGPKCVMAKLTWLSPFGDEALTRTGYVDQDNCGVKKLSALRG